MTLNLGSYNYSLGSFQWTDGIHSGNKKYLKGFIKLKIKIRIQ